MRSQNASVLVLLLGVHLAACSPSEPPAPIPTSHWSVAKDGLDRIPLCVFGLGEKDAWIGGGGLGSGPGALLLHWNGDTFAEIATSRSETIWWLGGTSGNDLWAVGEQGLSLHGDGASWTKIETGTTATLFGVWAAAKDDVWAVGGSPNGTGENAVLLHWNGSAWSKTTAPTATDATYFKVWGRAQNDVHLVGTSVAAHYDGKVWTSVDVPVKTSLFTVHGSAGETFAVGGGPPTVLRFDGTRWQSLTPPTMIDTMSGILSGVFADGSGTTFVVGERRQRYRLVSTTPEPRPFLDDTREADFFPADLHSVWGDGRGHALAVGGNYMALAHPGTAPRGIILRYAE